MQNTFDAYNKKRVSFIIQTKNHAQFLGQILHLCRRLKKENDELIVVDGASTDNTKEVVKQYQDLVDVFISEPDKDGNHAQNKALLLARGRFIKQLGDDDEFYPEAMEKAIETFEKNPDVDILLCGGVKDLGGKTRIVYLPPGINYGKSPEDVFKYLGPASGTGHFWRRSALAKTGLFALDNINADAEFVLRSISRGARVKFCRINLYRHIMRPHSVTRARADKHYQDTLRLIKKYCSPWFYFKYKARFIYRENKYFKPFRILLSRIRRKIYKTYKKIFKIPKKPKIEYIWDGGFS